MDQTAQIDWRDDRIPVSRQFDDPYFSLDNGLAETTYVFVAGNGLPERFGERFGGRFCIAETGFGTGLNFLTTWAAWADAGRPSTVHFTTFEAYPMALPDMRRALAAFPAVAPYAARLLAALEAGGPLDFDGITLQIVPGDVRDTLPRWDGAADAWYLDGFSPAKNPEMWGADVLTQVARHMVPGGSLATYTAAGHVRRALAAAGLEVARLPGYARKRHMTTARKPA